MATRLAGIQERYDAIGRELSEPGASWEPGHLERLGREQARLRPVAVAYAGWRRADTALAEARALQEHEPSPEMVAFLEEEAQQQLARRHELEQELQRLLLPADPDADRDAVVEIRAGTGGEEAALFAAELFKMYTRYGERRRWLVEMLDHSPSEAGGFKEVVFEVHGAGAYARLRFESGVHRVQRVPVTETQGRRHTSAASVVVLPEVDDVEVAIADEDLKVDVFRSTGPGGQSVNTTDSAVRITHLPTGLVVTCQDEKSQHKNKAKALRVLRSRLYDRLQAEREVELREVRRSMVRHGDRSEKVRTYNFHEERVTDHRIDLKLHQLARILDGELDPLIDPLLAAEQARQLGAEPA